MCAAFTPFALDGPAACRTLTRSEADPTGTPVLLCTLKTCASGKAPRGSKLSGEENFAFHFDGPDLPDANQKRWSLRKTGSCRRPEHDVRLDAKHLPNKSHRFGWLVETDPFGPMSTPVKCTALGRAVHASRFVQRVRRTVQYVEPAAHGGRIGRRSQFAALVQHCRLGV